MTDYEDWKTLAASSKRNNRGESIGHESASPPPDIGGTVLYAICPTFLPKLITGMLMIGIRAYLVEPPNTAPLSRETRLCNTIEGGTRSFHYIRPIDGACPWP